MTDAQQLFDYARHQFNDLAADVERHFEVVAGHLREWVPNADFNAPTHRPPPRKLPPPTFPQAVFRWIYRHRALTAALIAFTITGTGLVVWKSQQVKRKRRARRSESGARTDVVVIAGSPANALTSVLALDLERRGFVVYMVASTEEDAQYVRSQSRVDLLPLRLDLVDAYAAQTQLARFKGLLERDHFAFDGAVPHRLTLVGLVLVPDTQAPAASIAETGSEEWADALNAKVLNTIVTTQLFLPAIMEHGAKVLVLTPSVTPSLRLPEHGIESTVYGALEGFTTTLATELSPQGICVSRFKLGNLDIPSVTAKQRREGQQQALSRFKATPVRKLHDSVFEALVSSRPRRTWHVGRGSIAYDIIGSWLPAGVVGWMMRQSPRPAAAVFEDVTNDGLEDSQGSLTWEKVEQDA